MTPKKRKPTASLSLDLDNLWSYLKVHGEPRWKEYPTYLPKFVPIVLDLLQAKGLKITFFVVGKDASLERNHECLRAIAEAGHELANHSFHHEPWMQNSSEDEVMAELKEAEEAIVTAAGVRPRGFRGPGFCNSASILGALERLGYDYDASLLPSILGPVARLYYLWGSKMSKGDREERGDLFGHFSDGFRPLKPFDWKIAGGKVLEIPVTTIPVFRVPFHLSYLLWLSRFSPWVARRYMHFALGMCRLRGVEPSYLLHPLDFLGAADAPELAFFPAMDLAREKKLAFAGEFLDAYTRHFDVVTMSEHVRRIRERGRVKTLEPVLGHS